MLQEIHFVFDIHLDVWEQDVCRAVGVIILGTAVFAWLRGVERHLVMGCMLAGFGELIAPVNFWVGYAMVLIGIAISLWWPPDDWWRKQRRRAAGAVLKARQALVWGVPARRPAWNASALLEPSLEAWARRAPSRARRAEGR